MHQPSLWKKAIGGIGWMAFSNVLLASLQVAQMLILATLLGQDGFGQGSLALVFLSLGAVVVDFGLAAAVVRHRGITHQQFSTLVWVQLFLAVAVIILLGLGGDVAASRLQSPDLPRLLFIGSLGLIVLPFGGLFNATLLQLMRYKAVAAIESQAQIAGTLAAILYAWTTRDAASLVVGWVVRNLFFALSSLILARRDRRFGFDFQLRGAVSLLQFGRFDAGSQLINQASVGVDKLLLGYFSGPAFVGAYTLAWNIMSLPLGRITPVVTRVAFPIFSRLQEQLDEMKNGYIRLVYWLCAIQWPLFVGLGIVAEDFVLVLFGEKWLTAVPTLQVLCWVGAIRSIGVGGGVLLTAKGETKVLFRWNVFWTACLTLILVPFAYRGGEWLAWGQLVATLTGGLGWHWVIAKHGEIDYSKLIRQLRFPMYSILAMFVCLFLFRMFVVESPVIRLLGGIIVGGLAYIVTLIALMNTSNIPHKRS